MKKSITVGIFIIIVIFLAILLPDNRYLEIYYKISGGKIISKIETGDSCNIPYGCSFVRVDNKASKSIQEKCNENRKEMMDGLKSKLDINNLNDCYYNGICKLGCIPADLDCNFCNTTVCVYGCSSELANFYESAP